MQPLSKEERERITQLAVSVWDDDDNNCGNGSDAENGEKDASGYFKKRQADLIYDGNHFLSCKLMCSSFIPSPLAFVYFKMNMTTPMTWRWGPSRIHWTKRRLRMRNLGMHLTKQRSRIAVLSPHEMNH